MITAVTTRRPKLVWTIALWYGLCVTLAVLRILLQIVLQHSGNSLYSDVHALMLSSGIKPNYFFKTAYFADLAAMSSAALLLFRLRSSAVLACAVTLVLESVVSLMGAVDRTLVRMGFSPFAIQWMIAIAIVFNVLPAFAIFLYAHRLREKGVLS